MICDHSSIIILNRGQNRIWTAKSEGSFIGSIENFDQAASGSVIEDWSEVRAPPDPGATPDFMPSHPIYHFPRAVHKYRLQLHCCCCRGGELEEKWRERERDARVHESRVLSGPAATFLSLFGCVVSVQTPLSPLPPSASPMWSFKGSRASSGGPIHCNRIPDPNHKFLVVIRRNYCFLRPNH